MGTSLTGKNISASYLGLLKTTDNAIIGSTAKRLTDGGGTDSPLYLSTTQLGIGVSPMTKLHVQGTDVTSSPSAEQLIVAENNGNTAIGIFSSLTGQGSIDFGDSADNNAGRILYEHNDNALRFSTNGSSKMSILSDGKIGIGTSTVSSASFMEIKGVGSLSTAIVKLMPSDASSTTALYNASDGGDNQMSQYGTSSGDTILQHIASSGELKLRVNGTTGLTMNQSQNIKLDAYGSGTITGTATQRLGVDSSGNVIEIPIGAGAVDGSGTANTVTMWSDTDTITDAPITISGNNVNLSSGSSLYFGSTSVGITGNASGADYITFRTNANERARFDSSGRLGLGTSSPVYQVHIVNSANSILSLTAGTADNEYAQILFGDSANTAQGRIRYENFTDSMEFITNSGSAMTINSSQNATFAGDVTVNKTTGVAVADIISGDNYSVLTLIGGQTGDATNGFGIYSGYPSAGDFTIRENGVANYLTIKKTTGNVGISTDSPDAKLHIIESAGGANIVTALKLDPDDATVGSGTSIDFNASTINDLERAVGSRIVGAREGGNASGYLSFYTSPDAISSVPLERLRLDSSGQLAIGTTTATAPLTVAGTTDLAWSASTSKLQISRSGSLARLQNYESGSVANLSLQWEGASVGIGATTINEKLTTKLSNVAGLQNMFGIQNATDTSTLASFGLNLSNDQLILGSDYGASFLLKTNGTTALTIDTSQKIGIGTTSPAEKLHIVGDGDRLEISSADYDLVKIGAFGTSGADIDNGFLNLSLNGSEKIRLLANGDSYFNGGNVGIGESSPSEKLVVNGSIKNGVGYYLFGGNPSNPTDATASIYNGSGVGVTISSLNIAFRTGSSPSERLRITDGGELLVAGTFNSYSSANRGNITLNGTASNIIAFSNNTTATGYIYSDGTNIQLLNATSTGALQFYTNGANERVRITSGGKVLIGTTSDTVGGVGGHTLVIDTASQNLGIKTASGNQQAVRFANDTTAVGSINLTTTSTSYATSSDYRLKEDLQDFNALEIASKIKMYDFKWKADDSRSYGVMAHELQEVLPQAVTGEKDAKEMQGVDYSKLVPILLKSIQELEARVKELEKK